MKKSNPHIFHTEYIDNPFEGHHGYTKFGDIRSPGGALIMIRGENPRAGLKGIFYEELMAYARSMIVTPSPQIHSYINYLADCRAFDFIQKHKDEGFPSFAKDIFSFKKKREIEKYCQGLTLKQKDIAQLVFNCDQSGYEHTRFHKEYVPEELKLSEKEHLSFQSQTIGEVTDPIARKFMQKVRATFKQRKNINAHLFVKGEEWHLIWFTYDDMNSSARGKTSHWVNGDHIHYTSHLWGLDKETSWNKIKEKQYSINGIHIKYQNENR